MAQFLSLKTLSELFWNKEFWLPKNYSWSQIEKYNQISQVGLHLFVYPLSVAVLLYIIRLFFEKFIATPIGRYLKVKEEPPSQANFKPNSTLERYFNEKQSVLPESIYLHLARETKYDVDYIKEWFKHRRNLNKPTKLKKFTETFWRFFFYTSVWFYGLSVLYKKSWFWNTSDSWKKYPFQNVESDVYFYYLVELGFYFSLLVSQFFDIKRKDFWQMFIHHIVTIALLVFSYVCNFVRIGTLILLLHDCVDIWLEMAKMGTYTKIQWLSDTSFIIFTTVWFITRLVIFPFKILYSTTYEAPNQIGFFPAYYLFNCLLYILQVLHVIWFYIICRIAYRSLTSGKVEKDDRSESDDESENDDKNK